ncbi:hypothetical protein V8C37DRAFT_254267 [Trichoderma ceciliae]
MADLIDPTAKGNYPVILGDGLRGKTSNDIFTGIRYNHKPSFPTSDARLKPSVPGKTSSYDLNFSNSDGTVGFAGTRSTDDGDYVLHFDPERKAFILDKVDSTFNMNLTRIPGNSNPDELRRRFPHLESGQSQKAGDKKGAANKDKPKPTPKAEDKSITVQTKEMQKKLDKKPTEKKMLDKKHIDKKPSDKIFVEKKAPIEKKPVDKKPVIDKKPVEKQKKPMERKPIEKKPLEKKSVDKKPIENKSLEKKMFERKQFEKKLPKKIELALPVPEPPKPEEPKSQKKKNDDDDEEDEDDDGDLLIEYPGAETSARETHFSPAFPAPRRFDDFMDQRESEVDEDDGAMDEDPEVEFKLPSPVKNASQGQSELMDVDGEGGEEGEGEGEGEGEEAEEANDVADFELDLEQELENAFDQLDNNDQDNGNNGYFYSNNNANDDESEISEED